MSVIPEILLLVIEPLALACMVVYSYGFVQRHLLGRSAINMVMGGGLGLAAVVAMLSPLAIAPGVIVDIRCLFIGVAAAFFGPIGGAITLIMAATGRAMIGGDGMMVGIYGMALAYLAGLAWARFVQPLMGHGLVSLLILGAMMSFHLLSALGLPPGLRGNFYTNLAPVLGLANLAGAVALAKLLQRERRLLENERALLAMSRVDPLTNLPNRNTVLSAYNSWKGRNTATRGHTMLCVDIDFFKQINDQHGHLRGDIILKDVADRLAACLRPTDICARIGGDEFLILLRDVTPDEARTVAERCKNVINASPMLAQGIELAVSISIGGVWTDTHPSFDCFRDTADQALYRAKSAGRNCVAFDVAHNMTTSIAA